MTTARAVQVTDQDNIGLPVSDAGAHHEKVKSKGTLEMTSSNLILQMS